MTPIAFAATESLERTFEEDVQAADDCSIEVLIERYRQLIYGIALSGTGNAHDAEDVFQETFLAYYRAKKSFRSEEHRRAWLIRTACNHCKKITGSTWRKRTVSLRKSRSNRSPFPCRKKTNCLQHFTPSPCNTERSCICMILPDILLKKSEKCSRCDPEPSACS